MEALSEAPELVVDFLVPPPGAPGFDGSGGNRDDGSVITSGTGGSSVSSLSEGSAASNSSVATNATVKKKYQKVVVGYDLDGTDDSRDTMVLTPDNRSRSGPGERAAGESGGPEDARSSSSASSLSTHHSAGSGLDVNSLQDPQKPSRAPYKPYSSVSPYTPSECLKVTPVSIKLHRSNLSIRPLSTTHVPPELQDHLTRQTNEPKLFSLTSGERAAFVGLLDAITGQPLHGRLITSEKGVVYNGPFVCGKRHGDNATLEDVAQSVKFLGSFRNDFPHRGSLISPEYTYSGELDEHLNFHAVGSLATRDGVLYEGEFSHGRYDGVGREVLPNGTCYKGQYVGGNRHGIGTLFIPENEKELKLWSRGGEGRCKYMKKSSSCSFEDEFERYCYSYSGVWWHGHMEGEGIEIVRNRPTSGDTDEQKQDFDDEVDDSKYEEVYTGQFFRSKRHGFGILKLPQNLEAEGKWRAGLPVDGAGWSLTYPDGAKYHGSCVGFKPHGFGLMVYAEQRLIVNEDETKTGEDSPLFVDGTFVEDGDEEVYYGQFQHGKRDGEGLCVTRNGRQFRGIWSEDRLIDVLEEIQEKKFSREDSFREHVENGEEHKKSVAENVDVVKNESESEFVANLSGEHDLQSSNFDIGESSGEVELAQKSRDGNDEYYTVEIDFNADVMDTFAMLQQFVPDGFVLPSSLFGKEADVRDEDDGMHIGRQTSNTIHRYPNNDTFLGHVDCNGLRQGHGKYTEHRSGAMYEGEWADNKRHGRGVLVTAHVKYCGEYEDDKRHGRGTLIFDASSCYTGQFRNDVFHGVGTLCTGCGQGRTYSGDWINGQRHGEGLETFADGSVFLGEYRVGKRNGVGTLLAKRGGAVVYSGQWFNDTYHGEGVRVFGAEEGDSTDEKDSKISDDRDLSSYENDDKTVLSDKQPRPMRRMRQYEGTFANGKMCGFGTLTTEDGRVYRGKWCEDQPLRGSWTITLRDGSKYSGEAKRCEIACGRDVVSDLSDEFSLVCPHGHGTMKYSNGDSYTGNFIEGKRSGRGVCIFANGDRYDGEWSDDSLDVKGAGQLRLADGTIHTFGGFNKREQSIVPSRRSQ